MQKTNRFDRLTSIQQQRYELENRINSSLIDHVNELNRHYIRLARIFSLSLSGNKAHEQVLINSRQSIDRVTRFE